MPDSPVPTVHVRVPAKVNLHLGVGAVRPDGFHELVTVFHAVDICDLVSVRPASALSVSVSGEGAAELPRGPDNIAWRAAELLAQQAGVQPQVAVELHKAIPVAGGMAGGSADAAGTMLACARLWGVDEAKLPALAAQLGSDVAFGLVGETALGTGRGEVLEPVATTGELHWVFAVAHFGISAAAAYGELDRLRAAGLAAPPRLAVDTLRAALASGEPAAVAAALHNDLQAASVSIAPSLREVLDAGQRAGALAGIVSGSGPTCAFLCADATSASVVAAALTEAEICRDARVARGPAPGAVAVD